MTPRRKRACRAVVLGLALGFFSSLASGGQASKPPSVTFITPLEGTTVAGPRIEVALRVFGLKLVPAGSMVSTSEGHAHVLVDRGTPGAREFLSTDDTQIVHLGKPPLNSRAIDLSPGAHTLTAVLGDSEHLVVRGQRTDTIHVTVAPGFRGKGAITPACADVAAGAGEVRMTFPSAGGGVQGTISAVCVLVTQAGACSWIDLAFSRVAGSYDATTQRVSGQTTGVLQHRLRSGTRKTCGKDEEHAGSSSQLAAQLQADTLSGTVGRAHFAVTRDDTIDLAAAPPPLSSTEVKSTSSRRHVTPVVMAIFALAAALIVFAAVSALRPG